MIVWLRRVLGGASRPSTPPAVADAGETVVELRRHREAAERQTEALRRRRAETASRNFLANRIADRGDSS